MNSHHQFLNFLKNRELNELYVSVAIRALAISMISVFIPIYLLHLGYGLVSVFGFFLALNITRAIFMIVAAKISSRIGFKHTMLLNAPFLIAFYLLLYTLEYHSLPLYFLAIVLGIGSSLFWLGYHFDFAKSSNKKTRGQQVSIAKIFVSLFAVLGPLTGGLILYFSGFHLLFILASGLLFFSIVPLFFSKDVYEPFDHLSLKNIFGKRRVKNALAYMGHGVENSVAASIWPIFIFAILNSYLLLGSVSSLGLFFTMISTFMIGRMSDIRRRFVLKVGSISTALIWVVKIFITTTMQIFIIDSIHGITRTMKEVPFDALCYDKANKRDIMEHIVFREVFLQVGRIVLYSILMLTSSLIAGLLMGGGGALLCLFF